MPQRESLVDVVGLLVRHRRRLAQIVGAALALAIAIALASPVYYSATTTFLAASADLNNPSKIFATERVDLYGSGNDVERVIAAAESEETLRFLVDSFDLYRVYDVDSTAPDAATLVREELDEVYEVRRTKYDEIEVTVEDRDATRAAAMANAARDRAAEVIRATSLLGQRDMAALFQRSIETKQAQLAALNDSLALVSDRYGIIEPNIQGQQLAGLRDATTRAIANDSVVAAQLRRRGVAGRLRDTLYIIEARLAALRASRATVADQTRNYTTGGASARTLLTQYNIINDQLSYDLQRQQRVQTLMESPGPIIYVSNVARVPDRKSRPARTLIVVGITAAAFVFAALGIIVYDTYKDVDWRGYLK